MSTNAAESGTQQCPYLGLSKNPKTALPYPTILNYCHRVTPAKPVAALYQERYCLTPGYTGCPILDSKSATSLPPEARVRGRMGLPPVLGRIPWLTILLILLVVMLLVLLAIGWQNILNGLLLAAARPAYRSALAQDVPIAAPMATSMASDQAIIPVTGSSPASTASPYSSGVCGYAADQVFGDTAPFLVHQARGGESLESYAEQYGTTVAAILAASHDLQIPLQIDAMVVIPAGQASWRGPAFDAYYQPRDGASLAEILKKTGSGQADFLRYNAFGPACQTFTGWMLVPR